MRYWWLIWPGERLSRIVKSKALSCAWGLVDAGDVDSACEAPRRWPREESLEQ